MNRNILSFVVRLVISMMLIVAVFAFIDVQGIIASLRTASISYLMLALLFFTCHVGLWGFRWHTLLRDAGIDIPYFETLQSLLIGFAVALFFPSVIGSDVGRVYEMARSREQKVIIVSTVFVDRLLGLVTIVIMSVVAISIAGYQFVSEAVLLAIIGFAIATLIGWIIFFNRRLMRRFRWVVQLPIINRFESTLTDLYETAFRFQKNPQLFATLLTVSLLSAALEVLSIVMLTYALGVNINPLFHFLFIPIIWVILVIPISIGGLGVRETAFAFLYTQVGMVGADAVALSILYYSLGVIGGAIGIGFAVKSFIQTQQAKDLDHDS